MSGDCGAVRQWVKGVRVCAVPSVPSEVCERLPID